MSEMLLQLQQTDAGPPDLLNRARQLFQLAQFDSALTTLQSLPEDSEVAELRARCYQHLGRWLLEIGDLTRAGQVAEQHLRDCGACFEAYALQGEVASLRGDDAAALSFFSTALSVLPRDYAPEEAGYQEVDHLLYLRVASLVRLRRYDEALEHWRAVIKRNNLNSDLWYLGALCLVNTGKANEAKELCRRALNIDPHHIDAAKLNERLKTG